MGRLLEVGAEPEGITAGFDPLWVVLQAGGQLARIDPTSGEVLLTLDVGSGPRLVIAGGTSIWVSDFTAGTVVRVDPTTGTVTTSEEICDGPKGMAEVGDVLWVACSRSNELVGMAVEDLSVRERIDAAGTPDALAVGAEGAVVVALREGPALRLLDTEAVELGAATVLSDAPELFDQANIDVLVEGSTVWLSSHGEETVYELPLSTLG